ncbi:MAG: hypothetical protein WBB39_00235 [Candidatus Saccharimonadales bacterium]
MYRYASPGIRRRLIAVVFVLGTLIANVLFSHDTVHAATGINQQLNFQGRLYNAAGATVPDGYYNIQFKIYQDGTGTASGNPGGTLKWTESWLNSGSNGVIVRNGFISVQLGSITPFASNVDWNQDTLWLSMNIGDTSSCTITTTFDANCGGDGEMVPMKRLSSTPYALNAGMLGGLTASGFIQNTTTPQTANIAVQSAAAGNVGAVIQGASSQTANLLELRDNGGLVNASFNASGNQLTLGRIAGSGTVTQGKLVLADGTTDNFGLTLESATLTANRTIVLPDSTAASDTVCLQTLQNCGTAGANTALSNLVSTSINQSLVPGSSYGNLLDLGSSSYTWHSGYFGSVVYTPAIRPLTDSATALKIQNAAGTTDLITFDTTGAGSTTIGGTTKVTPQSSTSTTLLCSNTGIISTCDASVLAPTATNFIQNSTSLQGSSNFWISGTGKADTGLQSPSLDATSGNALTIGVTNATSITIGKSTGATSLVLSSSTIGLGIATAPTTLQATSQTTAATQGATLTIQGATSGTTGTGGTLAIQGGNSASGTTGGNVTISGGTGSVSNGLVLITTPTFSTTANDANCYTGGALVAIDCTIAQTSVNNSSAIIVGLSVIGKTVTLPDPSVTTAGRIVYVTAANSSVDFTLSVNGGGQGNLIAMRQNTTATMIWNGSDWTAAGASSSTTLQSAYDNTLQSAGGAELVVSKTSATNGLTIRDSSVNSVNGSLLSVQTSSASGLFQVNSNVTEYVSNAGAETAGASSTTFPASTWAAVGTSTVTRNVTTTNSSIATGQASVSIVTTASANAGVKNTLVAALGTLQNYNVSFTARLSSGTFTDMNVYYSVDGTAASVPCTTSQAIATSVWTKVNCAFTAPASGITSSNAILIRQTGATARTFYVDNLSVTIAADYNYATDGVVTDSGNFATNWSAVSGSTVTRSTTVGNDASDSAQAVTAATAGQGVRNKLSISPLASTLYRVTVYAASSNSFSDFTVRYSRDGGTSFATCADYNTQSVSTSLTSFTKITCYITTDASAATNPYVYFTQNTGTARTFYVDTFSMTLASNTTPNVQIGGGVNGGPTTLFTLDRGASAPIASNNDALLGSMYYDTTLGKLQCYEADGWGACGSSPDNIVTISPEYTNAVLHGTGIGTMTSDLCSDYLNINDGSGSPAQPTICGTNETYNFYKWTSPQATAQTYAIYVTYQLPSTFKEFNSGQTSLMGRTDNGSNGGSATVQYQIYRNSGTGLSACGSTISVSTGTQTSWQIGNATGAADPSTCGFTPGNSIVFKIDMTTSKNANAYVGNLNFAFSNK